MTDGTGPLTPDACYDAVVIVPGIMGSELRDAATRTVLWGMSSLGWYVRAWTTGDGLAALRLTEQERDGHYGRVSATGLLRVAAYARVLAGIEPYTALVQRVRRRAVHPDAVREFPYDWRLSVAHNAEQLAKAADEHLTTWRDRVRADRTLAGPGGREPRLAFVAHSMGGLLVRYLATIPGFAEKIRTSITLGTPFYGSVKAAVLLNSGRGAPVPLPARRPIRAVLNPAADDGLRALAASLPGVHDLLPTYRCVDETPADLAPIARRLTVDDVHDLGGDRRLAERSFELHERLRTAPPIGHRAVIGVAQPTMQSLSIADGLATPHWYECRGEPGNATRVDRMGDGTVYRDAATLDARDTPLPAQHAALAKTDEAIAIVCAFLTGGPLPGPPMAADELQLGLETPDVVDPDEEWTAPVTGITHPRHARCTILDEETGRQVAAPGLERRDGELVAVARLPRPGIYRVQVAGSGYTPVSRLLMVADPDLARG